MEKQTTLTRSSAFIQDLNDRNQHGAILKRFKTTLPEVKDSYPLMQLINLGANKEHLEAIVSVLLLRAANFITSQGNLRESHALEIAKNIIQDYPLLSLEDINLLLLNGVKGRYGQIYRLDISIIYEWIRAYEDEKAQFVEVEMKKEIKHDEVEMSEETKKMIAEWMNNLQEYKPKDKTYDMENPKAASTGYKYGTEKDHRIIDLRSEYGRRFTDLYTGKPKPDAPTFEEFLAQNGF